MRFWEMTPGYLFLMRPDVQSAVVPVTLQVYLEKMYPAGCELSMIMRIERH